MMNNTNETHAVGTAVYYTGDVANISGKGSVVAIRPGGKWGDATMDIALEDGRRINAIPMACFSGIGRRFWTMEEYRADREKKIAQMKAEYEALMARRQAN